MDDATVLDRVTTRHPELSEEDVLYAWANTLAVAFRIDEGAERQVGIGVDQGGRLIEMVAARTEDGRWLIYHAMTPPSKKTMTELRMARG